MLSCYSYSPRQHLWIKKKQFHPEIILGMEFPMTLNQHQTFRVVKLPSARDLSNTLNWPNDHSSHRSSFAASTINIANTSNIDLLFASLANYSFMLCSAANKPKSKANTKRKVSPKECVPAWVVPLLWHHKSTRSVIASAFCCSQPSKSKNRQTPKISQSRAF